MTALLVAKAWSELLYVDLVGVFGFWAIRRIVGRPPAPAAVLAPETVSAVVEAVRTAKVLYVKDVFCLQHSAVITRLLRRRGVPAELVIGCHLAPMRAHAWVELAGEVIVEQRDDQQYLCILDRW